jgi:hypothetical protein
LLLNTTLLWLTLAPKAAFAVASIHCDPGTGVPVVVTVTVAVAELYMMLVVTVADDVGTVDETAVCVAVIVEDAAVVAAGVTVRVEVIVSEKTAVAAIWVSVGTGPVGFFLWQQFESIMPVDTNINDVTVLNVLFMSSSF